MQLVIITFDKKYLTGQVKRDMTHSKTYVLWVSKVSNFLWWENLTRHIFKVFFFTICLIQGQIKLGKN